MSLLRVQPTIFCRHTRSLCSFIKAAWLCIDENFHELELFFLREIESHTCYLLDLSPRNFVTFQGSQSLQSQNEKNTRSDRRVFAKANLRFLKKAASKTAEKL